MKEKKKNEKKMVKTKNDVTKCSKETNFRRYGTKSNCVKCWQNSCETKKDSMRWLYSYQNGFEVIIGQLDFLDKILKHQYCIRYTLKDVK